MYFPDSSFSKARPADLLVERISEFQPGLRIKGVWASDRKFHCARFTEQCGKFMYSSEDSEPENVLLTQALRHHCQCLFKAEVSLKGFKDGPSLRSCISLLSDYLTLENIDYSTVSFEELKRSGHGIKTMISEIKESKHSLKASYWQARYLSAFTSSILVRHKEFKKILFERKREYLEAASSTVHQEKLLQMLSRKFRGANSSGVSLVWLTQEYNPETTYRNLREGYLEVGETAFYKYCRETDLTQVMDSYFTGKQLVTVPNVVARALDEAWDNHRRTHKPVPGFITNIPVAPTSSQLQIIEGLFNPGDESFNGSLQKVYEAAISL